MINIGLYYSVKKGHEAEFESTFLNVVSYLKKNIRGFKDASIYKKVGSSSGVTDYMLYSDWGDIGSFREFMKSSAFKETTSRGRDIIEGRPYHRIFTEVGDMEKNA